MASLRESCLSECCLKKHFVIMFSHGELGHSQVELYQTVQHKNIQSWEENELDKSQPTDRESVLWEVVFHRNPLLGEKACD